MTFENYKALVIKADHSSPKEILKRKQKGHKNGNQITKVIVTFHSCHS